MPEEKKPLLDFGKFFEAFRGESDRAAAVLGAAYLETQLEILFRSRLIPSANERLFEFRGPLGDFSGKIELAFTLGWLSADSRTDLNIVRRIRNSFAHDVDHELSFVTPSISDQTQSLSVINKLRSILEQSQSAIGKELLKDIFATSRKRFEIAVAWLEMAISIAQSESQQATIYEDQLVLVNLGPLTLEPGESAIIDLESGTRHKDSES